MKIGIYGGSFNPIHFGHIGLAKWVTENTDLNEVWLMVSPSNPLKSKSILVDEQERLVAAKETIGDGLLDIGKRIVVSDFEFHLPRPTYTANTLRALAKEYPEYDFTLIIGEDNLQIFNKWREYEYILKNYRLFVYPRRKAPKNATSVFEAPAEAKSDEAMRLLGNEAKEIIFLEGAPYFDISSTELRKNLHK
ncbi:MAG: nicotinate (nicotinamide) nucleotide adenylyltransferase [Paludibacteraceae bacterium]|nr:nicotinate (nicotinamide) nucleotide adenylyltransferase [Paludibacteraceae bacterium]